MRPGARRSRQTDEYVGSDIEPGPNVRYVCPVEQLEIPDESYDVVLCTQVLEHSVMGMHPNRDARPRWKAGDFFGQRFGR